MIAAVIVGVLGFTIHLSGDLADNGQLSIERMLVFAPVVAPLLYSDLGILGLIVVANEGSRQNPREIELECWFLAGNA